MGQTVKLRRSAVSGRVPINSQLQLGELSVNTADGKLFFAKSGSLGPSIEEIITTNTQNTGSIDLVGALTASVVSSSFVGDGRGLYNIPATGVTGLSLDKITSGPATASISETRFDVNVDTVIDGSLTVTEITGSGLGLTNVPVNISGSSHQSTNYDSSFTKLHFDHSTGIKIVGDTTTGIAKIYLDGVASENESGVGNTKLLTVTTASSTWTFNHGLGEKYPSIVVFDGNDNVVIPQNIEAVSESQLIVSFASPQTGYVTATVGGGLPSNETGDYKTLVTENGVPTWKEGILSGSISFDSYSSSIDDELGVRDLRLDSLELESGSVKTTLGGLNTYTSSTDGRLDSIESKTGSFLVSNDLSTIEGKIGSLETTSGSHDGRLDSLETESGSVRTTLNTYTSSNDGRVDSIESQTGSYLIDSDLSTLEGQVGSLETESGSVRSTLNTYTSSNDSRVEELVDFKDDTETAIELTGSNVTIKGNLLVKGTETRVNSTTVEVSDNVISLNGSGAANGGIEVRDITSPGILSGSLIWDGTDNKWKAGVKGSEDGIVLVGDLNSFTSSNDDRLDRIELSTSSLNSFTSSINTTIKTKLDTEGVISGSIQIDHDSTTNFVANEHIDHSSITIGSGKGLSGGGSIDTSRSLTLDTGSAHFLGGVKTKLNTETVVSGSVQIDITGTTNYNLVDGRLDSLESNSGSYLTEYNDEYTTGATFNSTNGVITYTRNDGDTFTVDIDGRYLTSFTETDPIFTASPSAGITETNITNWDSAYTYSTVGHLPLSGGTITGDVRFLDDDQLRLGNGNDLRLWHNGTNSYVFNYGGSMFIGTRTNDTTFLGHDGNNGDTTYFKIDGTNQGLYYYKSQFFADGVKSHYGANNDLEIYHDGSNSYITEKGTGNLNIKGGQGLALLSSSDEFYFYGDTNGQVNLYHNGLKKFETTSGGIEVSGTIVATGYNDGNWNTAYGWGDHSTVGYITGFTNTNEFTTGATFNSGNGVVTFTRNNGGDTFTVDLDGRYLTSFTETDPIFTASPSAGITETNISNWDTAYGWGDHSQEGYITSFTDTNEFTTGATFNSTTGIITFTRNNGGDTFTVDIDGKYLPLSGGTITGDLEIKKTDPKLIFFDSSGANGTPNGEIVFSELDGYENFKLRYNGTNDRYEYWALIGNVSTLVGYWNRSTGTSLHSVGSISTGTDGNSTQWNTSYGWGDHSAEGYLTSYNDEYTTGVTWTAGTATLTFTRNDGDTYNVQMLETLTDVTVTGGTYASGTQILTLTKSDGSTVDVSGFAIDTDVNWYTTGATFNTGNGIITGTLNSGSTWTVDIDNRYLQLGGGTLTGNLTLNSTNPEILFNGTSDVGVDMAIKATPEGLDFYEPEDGNKIHFQILDDAGVNSAFGLQIGGTQVLSSSRVLTNVTGNISMFTNDSNYLTSYVETDPVFTASPSAGITETNISNWDTAYGWGNHASAGYITGYSEVDTLATVTSRGSSTTNDISVGDFSATHQSGDDATTKAEMLSYAVAKFRPHSTNSGTLAIAQVDGGNSVGLQFTNGAGSANWDMSLQPFGGNVGINKINPAGALHVYSGTSERFLVSGDVHVQGSTDLNINGTSRRLSFTNGNGTIRTTNATELYLQTNSTTALTIDANQNVSVVGTLSASNYNNTNWDSAYGWGDHSTEGYITGYNETDPTYTSERDSLRLNKMVQSTLLFNVLEDYNKPSGYSTMIQPTSYQNPLTNSHGYYHILGRRDGGGGYGALLQSYNGNELFHGNTTQNTNNITWYKIWTDSNFTQSEINNWGTAYGWGDHSSAGYITGYSEVDTLATVTSRGSSTTTSVRFSNDLNYFGKSTGNNEGEIVINTGIAGSPQIGFTEHGDASWAIGIDDADNSFKIHGTATNTIPEINGLAIPLFEVTTTAGVAYLNNNRIHHAGDFSTTDVANGVTAYGWGDHSLAGYTGDQDLSGYLLNTTDTFAGNLTFNGGNNNSKESFLNVKRGSGAGLWLKFQTDSTSANNVSQFVIRRSTDNVDILSITATSGNLSVPGTLSASGYNDSNWNTAYGWGDHSGNYLPIGGGTLTGDLTVGSITKTSNSVVKVLADQSYKAGFEAYGNGQGTGYVYVGQSTSHGGGMSYNGDGSPALVSGESSDRITFYRRTNSVDSEVFSYNHNSDSVYFNGEILPSTINTGQGSTEVHLMNQNIRTTDDVQFGKGKFSEQVSVNNRTAMSVAHWSRSGNTTGAIKIKIPGTHTSNWSMLVLRITTYEYNSNAHAVYYVSGHDWTSGWYNNGVTVQGTGKLMSLGFSTGANEDYVILGDVESTWQYGHVTVDVVVHPEFYDSSMDITSGWVITQETELDGITINSVTNKQLLDTSNYGTNISNWNTAYGWGDHSLAGYTGDQDLSGYATETYVGDQIDLLVDTAPGTLDTLNELAAALGDDPNFATTITTSIGNKLPLSGGTLTGDLIIQHTDGAPGELLHLRNDSSANGATIKFSDLAGTGQHGLLSYYHADTASYGSGNSFVLHGSEASMSFVVKGKVMYSEGIYTTPATGTGAGTRKDANWDTAYGWGDHSTEGYLTSDANYLKSNADDTFTGKLSVGSTNNRRAGIYGTYDSNKIGHIWSMGTAYQIPNDGSDFGNLYGIAYKHTNNTTGGSMAGGHQAVFTNNGTAGTAISFSGGIWTSGTLSASGYNDGNWNTAYGWGDHSQAGYLTSSSTQSKYLRSDEADEATQLTVNTLIIGSSAKIQFQNNDFIRYDDANGVGRFHFDSDGGTNNASVQAATFVGSLSGNATTATSSTNLYGLGYIQSNSSGTSYQNNYQIRENNGAGSNTAIAGAPTLAFHWSGVVASSIMMEASGRIGIRNNPGTGYEDFIANVITATGGNSGNWNTAYTYSQVGHLTSSSTLNASNMTTGTLPDVFSNSTRYNIGLIDGNGSQTRDKIRVWTDGAYSIGMKSGYQFGHLGNDYAMSFQMNAASNRGFWWGTNSDTDNQGAMALTTDGRANIKKSLSIGQGNTTSPSSTPLYVEGTTAGATVFEVHGTQGPLFSISDDMTGDIFEVSDISGVPILTVNASGTVTVDDTLHVKGDVIAYHSSDKRLKDNIKPILNPLDKIKLIGGYEFDWNEQSKNEGHDVGVIAQEIEEVLPELVSTRNDGYKGVKYEKITALLIEANKELLNRVEELEKKLIEK